MFGDKKGNREAIANQGWDPFTKALLLHPLIMAIMTESMIKDECKQGIFPAKVLAELNSKLYNENNGDVSFGVTNDSTKANTFNFKGGAIASHVANCIMAKNDMEEAREQNKKLKEEGKSMTERVKAISNY